MSESCLEASRASLSAGCAVALLVLLSTATQASGEVIKIGAIMRTAKWIQKWIRTKICVLPRWWSVHRGSLVFPSSALKWRHAIRLLFRLLSREGKAHPYRSEPTNALIANAHTLQHSAP